MAYDYNLLFIQRKLDELHSAVMYTMGNPEVKLPNDVISFLEIDETGALWFTAHKPKCWLRVYQQVFPVRLFFYRKGVDFYMEVSGTAVIADQDEVRNNKDKLPAGALLLKMQPHCIEYTETEEKSFFDKLGNTIIAFFQRLTHWAPRYTPSASFSELDKSKGYG